MKSLPSKLVAASVALLALAGLTACNRQAVDPPPADIVFLQGQVDQLLVGLNSGGNLANCLRLNSHVAGQYALIEVVCDEGRRLEFVCHARQSTVIRGHIESIPRDGKLMTEEQIMVAVGAPQMEAWMLVDKRDHPH
jgi:hypothetical protein